MLSDPGSPALHALADLLGTAGDADDEHWRWQVASLQNDRYTSTPPGRDQG